MLGRFFSFLLLILVLNSPVFANNEICQNVLAEIGDAKVAHAVLNKLEELIQRCDSSGERCRVNNYHTLRSIVSDFLALKPMAEGYHKDLSAIEELLKGFSTDGRALTIEKAAVLREFKDTNKLSRDKIQQQVRSIKKRLVKFLDPDSDKATVLTISPPPLGSGGPNAGIAMHTYFEYIANLCKKNGWTITNIKEVTPEVMPGSHLSIGTTHLSIEGPRAYDGKIDNSEVRRILQHENGLHTFQRTEDVRASPLHGKTVTSKIQVRIAPELAIQDVKIDESELNIAAKRSGGKGGQNVNKRSTAITVTHIPTGITSTYQGERSQNQNKMTALRNLADLVSAHYARQAQNAQRDSAAALPTDYVRFYYDKDGLRVVKFANELLNPIPIQNFLDASFLDDTQSYAEYLERLDDQALRRLLRIPQ